MEHMNPHLCIIIPRRRRGIEIWRCPSGHHKLVSISQRLLQIWTWNFRGVWISLRRSALHKNHNPPFLSFSVIALCYFSYLNFVSGHLKLVGAISQRLLQIWTWNFRGVYISLRRSALHKNHNPPLPNFKVIALWGFFLLKFCVEHISVTTKDISMKLYR